MDNIKLEILTNLFRSTTSLQAFETLLASMPQYLLRTDPAEAAAFAGSSPVATPSQEAIPESRIELPIRRELPKVGRNDACPCGSGKKFKNCCGR